MKPSTQKFVAPIPKAADDVHKAVALALKDKRWAAGVKDQRILWTVADDGVHAYYQTPEEGD